MCIVAYRTSLGTDHKQFPTVMSKLYKASFLHSHAQVLQFHTVAKYFLTTESNNCLLSLAIL